MYAKSLAAFVVVGVVAGLAFGLYLVDARHAGQLVFVEGSSLSIVTEKSDFKKGEPIQVRVVNSGTTPLTFPDTSYGFRITGLSGMLMHAPAGGEIVSNLEPRQEVEFVWDQVKIDGDMALEGLYKIHARGHDPQNNSIEGSSTVVIWK